MSAIVEELFNGAFGSSFASIVVTELGDKTFFIAALMAMRHARLPVFLGAAGALAAMTILSAAMGLVLPVLLPPQYAHWAAVVFFFYVGFKLIREAAEMVRNGEGTGPSGELEEVEQSLKDVDEAYKLKLGAREEKRAHTDEPGDDDDNAKEPAGAKLKKRLREGGLVDKDSPPKKSPKNNGVSKDPPLQERCLQPGFANRSNIERNSSVTVALQVLTMTFLAEWGDRSQFATIALATSKPALWVTLGGVVGHCCCTGLAVMGGRVLASKISERLIVGCGGLFFLAFAAHGTLMVPPAA